MKGGKMKTLLILLRFKGKDNISILLYLPYKKTHLISFYSFIKTEKIQI